MSTIKSFWRGEEALWRVWLIAFPIAWVILAVTLILSQKLGDFTAAVITIFIVDTWLLVSLWRCSKNTKSKFWRIANRGLILLNLFIGAIALLVLNLR